MHDEVVDVYIKSSRCVEVMVSRSGVKTRELLVWCGPAQVLENSMVGYSVSTQIWGLAVEERSGIAS